MKLSKQRKATIAVLALALLAFAVDKVFLGAEGAGPRRAAGATPGLPAGAAHAAPADGATLAGIPTGPSLADRLRDVAVSRDLKTDAVRDAFAPAQSWMPKPTTRPATTRPARQRPAFGKTHTLMALMAGPNGSAIVDGECLRIGDKLDGYTLVSVTRQAAVFQCGGRQVRLGLPGPAALKE